MYQYVVRRLFYMLPTLLIAIVISFLLMHFIPGDPISTMLGPNATEAQIDLLKRELGLDSPVYVQLWMYLVRLCKGDLGISIRFQKPVSRVMLERAETTILLTLLAIAFVLVVGVPSGIVAGVRPNTIIDQSVLSFTLLGAAVPTFWLGLLLMMLFSLHLGWLPSSGFHSVLKTGNIANLRYLILPAIALGTVNSALIARLTRASFLEVLSQDYIATARAKGLRETRVLLKHALRNAAIPIATVLGFTVAALLAGTVITENVFALPGLGRLLVDSILSRDYPIIQGIMLVIVFVYMFVNLLTDIVYALIDPRIQYQ